MFGRRRKRAHRYIGRASGRPWNDESDRRDGNLAGDAGAAVAAQEASISPKSTHNRSGPLHSRNGGDAQIGGTGNNAAIEPIICLDLKQREASPVVKHTRISVTVFEPEDFW